MTGTKGEGGSDGSMRRPVPTASITFTASLAVIIFVVLSDTAPLEVDYFAELEGVQGRVRLCCIIKRTAATEKGIMLYLQDQVGGEVRAFCSNGSIDLQLPLPQVALIIGRVERDRPGIVFVETVQLQNDRERQS